MHRARSPLGLPAVLALLAAAGCCSAPSAPLDPTSFAATEDAEAALQARFEEAVWPFDGFAASEPDGAWRIGDEVLYGVEYDDGRSRRRWLLVLRVESTPFAPGELKMLIGDGEGGAPLPDDDVPVRVFSGGEFSMTLTDKTGKSWKLESDSILVSASTWDTKGERLERTVSVVPEGFLGAGFHRACIRSREIAAEGIAFENLLEEAGDDFRGVVSEAYGALITLFRTLENNDALAEILWKVIEKPSVLSVVLRRGVSVGLGPRFELAEEEERELAGLPARAVLRFPVEIDVNDSAALHALLGVARSHVPLRVGAGIVSIDGRHPRKPERIVRVRLLASRRGPEPPPAETESSTGSAD